MGKLKVAINGMGRIGRTLVREWSERTQTAVELVAVNNPGSPEQYVHLLKYDSVHGTVKKTIRLEGDYLFFNDKKMKFFNQKDPAQIPWGELGVDIVIDATGKFKDGKSLSAHLRDSVKKVILCAPGKDVDATLVMGINHQTYDSSKHHIVSNASCTTNCLVPIVKVLHEKWGITSGFMTTVHSYTSDQSLLDSSHSDLRRARAAAMSMIPTTTGAAKSVGLVIPELKGKLDGFSVRVPTPNVSLVDLNVELKKEASIKELNRAFIEASQGELKGILSTSDEELVSSDYNGMRESSCVDLSLTNSIGKTVKVVSWYDNEVGFSNRVLDLADHIANQF